MNFSRSIGSIVIPIYLLMSVAAIAREIVLKTTLLCYTTKGCRKIGMAVESKDSNFLVDSGKLVKESYYELSIGVWLHSLMLMTFTDEWALRFFGTGCDGGATVLAIITCILMIILPIHAICLIRRNTFIWDKQSMMQNYSIYFENLRL